MFLINVFDYLLMFDFTKYIFISFVTYGVVLCIRKLIMNKGA